MWGVTRRVRVYYSPAALVTIRCSARRIGAEDFVREEFSEC